MPDKIKKDAEASIYQSWLEGMVVVQTFDTDPAELAQDIQLIRELLDESGATLTSSP